MTRTLCWIIAVLAVLAPGVHLVSDVMEWASGGFSRIQLLINYMGFLPMPFLMLGLYAVQRPKIGWVGLLGAILYGASFIYFAHTTLYALEASIPNYELLWQRLGGVYTFHGGLMVMGGLLFGFAVIKARVLWQGGGILFIVGIVINLGLALVSLPEILQTAGSTIRNLGLMGMGVGLIRTLIVHYTQQPNNSFDRSAG